MKRLLLAALFSLALFAASALALIGTSSPASAQIITDAQGQLPIPFVQFVGTATAPSGSGTATRTWSGAPIGTLPATGAITTRRVIVGFANASAGLTVSSCTIATIASDQVNNVGSGSSLVSFMSAVVPTGSTGAVAITFSGNDTAASRIFIYVVDDTLLSSKTPAIVSNTSGASTSNTVDVPMTPGGFAITILNPTGSTGTPPFVISPPQAPWLGLGLGDAAVSAGAATTSTSMVSGYQLQTNGHARWQWANSVGSTLAVAAWR